MKAIIVYDTKYGMTEKIAQAILAGMKEGGLEVISVKADNVTEADLKNAEVWVFGSPVHIGGATGDAKRAVKLALKSDPKGKKGTTFDTRFVKAEGKGASGKMRDSLEEEGVKIIVEPQWFIVEATKGPIAGGEEAKATAFGIKIAAAAK